MTQLKDMNSPSSLGVLEKAAAEWLARLDTHGLFDGESVDLNDYAAQDARFAAWLNQSPSHRVALLRMISVWRRTHRLAALKSPGHITPVKSWGIGLQARKILGAAIAASLLLFVIGTMNNNPESHVEHSYQTAKGGQRIETLADGSKIILNSDTKLHVTMSARERLIVLEQGEAVFEVKRNENSPFKVVAGEQLVTVLGTKFGVHRKAGEIEIAVTEGKVKVDVLGAPAGEEPSVVMKKGDIAKTNQGTILVMSQGLETVNRELSWRQGYIIFDEMPLSEAAAEFNRYNDRMLIINDPQIADIHVSGKFKTDNLSAFVRLLTEGFGFQVTDENDEILVSG